MTPPLASLSEIFPLLLGTRNAGKLTELRAALLRHLGPDAAGCLRTAAEDLPDFAEPDETAPDIPGNARLKARAYAAAAGCCALADDTGLVIDALGGAPGVHSARYAATPEARMQRVLDELAAAEAAAPDSARSARFLCAMAIANPAGEILAESIGCLEGEIARETRGTGGFGYDPIFIVRSPQISEQLDRRLSEYSTDEKNAISHRGMALERLLHQLTPA